MSILYNFQHPSNDIHCYVRLKECFSKLTRLDCIDKNMVQKGPSYTSVKVQIWKISKDEYISQNQTNNFFIKQKNYKKDKYVYKL